MSILILSAAVATVLIGVGFVFIFPDYWILRKLAKSYVRPEYIRDRIRRNRLNKKVRTLDGLSRRYKINLIQQLGLGADWADRLEAHLSIGFGKHVLRYCPYEAVLPLFRLALKKKSFASHWKRWWTQQDDDSYLIRLGEKWDFHPITPQQASDLLGGKPEVLERGAVNSTHKVRYLAVKALLGGGERFRKILEACFHDPSTPIRCSICTDVLIFEKVELHERLLDLVLNDSVFRVRCAAFARIMLDSPDLFIPSALTLNDSQVIHILDFLRAGEVADENLGFHYLESDNLMIRQKAAFFLERSGSLEKIFGFADAGDKISFARMVTLLEKAGEVHVTGYLQMLDRTTNPSTLVAAARLLRSYGSVALIFRVAERIFRLMDDTDEAWMAYRDIIEAISIRGDDEAMKLLKAELIRRRTDLSHLVMILAWLPERGAEYYAPILFDWLKTPGCLALNEIEVALVKFPNEPVIPGALELLTDFTSTVPATSRICVLKVLVQKKTIPALRLVLEHFYLVPIEIARTMTRMMSQYLSKEFDEHVMEILDGWDNPNRRSLIAALPGAGGVKHYQMVLNALTDTDPEIRIAALWSILEFNQNAPEAGRKATASDRSPDHILALISDPDRDVRINAIRALAIGAGEVGLAEVAKILNGKNEIDMVVKSVLKGLGESHGKESLDILLKKSAINDEYVLDCIEALSKRRTEDDLMTLVSSWQGSAATARFVLEKVFEKNGEICGPLLDSLLGQESVSLNEDLQEVFNKTGFLSRLGLDLKSKKAELRHTAVRKLGLIGSRSAARFLLSALKDPDPGIRAKVIEILGAMDGDFSSHLGELTHDPDRRVRQYAHWALERMSPVQKKG